MTSLAGVVEEVLKEVAVVDIPVESQLGITTKMVCLGNQKRQYGPVSYFKGVLAAKGFAVQEHF